MNPKFEPTNKSSEENITEVIPVELQGENLDGYMEGDLDDIDEISEWIDTASLEKRNHRVFSDFEIYDAIDGAKKKDREVSLVVAKHGSYPQHTQGFRCVFCGSGWKCIT